EIIKKLTPNPNEENTNIDIETLEDIFILDENQDNSADANNNKKHMLLHSPS
ncbi:13861_t:CDS:2, partial [Funneliformis mosseae]